MPGDFALDTGSRSTIAEIEEALGVEEELRDRPGRARVELCLEIVQIGLPIGRVRVDFGIGRHRYLEIGHALETGDQFDRIGIAIGMRAVGTLPVSASPRSATMNRSPRPSNDGRPRRRGRAWPPRR